MKRLLRCESGQNLVEMALVAPLLALMLVGAVDLGRAFYFAIQVKAAAHAGATYGSQYPTDTTGMKTAADDNAQNIKGLTSYTSSASWGCECWDGTNKTAAATCSTTPPTCTTNTVYYVTVTVSGTYSTLIPWPGIPATIPLSETVVMRSANF
jgi:Flp pilus assembly protein TadG